MTLKLIKLGMLTLTGTGLAAGLLFGRDAYSYVTSSARQMQNAVHDAVPVEFQLHRAQDLVNDIVPEIQANVRAIAQQEVQIESLKADIADSTKSLDDEKTRMAKLRDCLNTAQTSFTFADCTYTRQQLKDDLGRRFDASKEAAVVLAGKQRLLQNQQNSLVAAEQMLERTRSEKQNLESQIATLEAQNRLVQAASVGTASEIDNTKLAQSQKLIADIKTQLDVAERVLAHESHFVEPIQIDTVSDKDLIGQVDAYLASADPAAVKADASAVKADPSVANADPAAVSAAH